jgi:uncharacterized damage-inducible protein DinB
VETIFAIYSHFHLTLEYAVSRDNGGCEMDYQKELLAEYDREIDRTRTMLKAIPEGTDFSFKPHEKSMTLGRLAGHLTDMTGDWALHTLTLDKLDFPADHKWEQYVPENKAALVSKLDSGLDDVRKALAELSPEKWDQNWQFIFGGHVWIDQPRHQVFRELVMSHMVHHRAQLGVYIRLLGAKLPGMYGPSADEM